MYGIVRAQGIGKCGSGQGLGKGETRDWWLGRSGMLSRGYSGLVGTGYEIVADWQTTKFQSEGHEIFRKRDSGKVDILNDTKSKMAGVFGLMFESFLTLLPFIIYRRKGVSSSSIASLS